jgi:hypothetical protein
VQSLPRAPETGVFQRQRSSDPALRKPVFSSARGPVIDDPLNDRMLRLDGTDDEVAAQAIGARTPCDVVNVEVGDRGGDHFALPIDDGMMDEGAVGRGHGGGLITGAGAGAVPASVPASVSASVSALVGVA